jgi:hypothetical protein
MAVTKYASTENKGATSNIVYSHIAYSKELFALFYKPFTTVTYGCSKVSLHIE